MRFWQKIFLFSLALLIVTISTVSLLLLRANHIGNIEQARQDGHDTHDLLAGALQSTVINQRYQSDGSFLTEPEMLKSIADLAESYSRQPLLNDIQVGPSSIIYFQLFDRDSMLFSNLPVAQSEAESAADRPELAVGNPSERLSVIRKSQNGSWLFISSIIELESRTYTFVTVKDVSMIYQQLNRQINMFADLMLVLSMAAAVALLLIVVVLTRPIAVLRKYTSRFSRGEYNIRLAISGHDELAELGHDFNAMAEAVEKNILSLRQMNEERTRFIDNLTHEIRSPLTSIIGFADLMRQAPELSREERVRQSEYIYKEGRHLQNISRLLMELTLLGQADFELEAVDLFDLLEETSLLSEPVMKKYQTILELENEHGFVNVNLELFRSLLSNLIENAGKASQPGDTIILRGKAVPSGGMRLTVQDSGCGIPKEELKKIRQPFYVLDKARTRSSGGAGLGLALCDEIARIHGSELIIESEIGRGTAVSLLFSPVQEVIDDDAFSK